MSKWYENEKCGIIISSRVRLARNLKKYNFHNKLSNGDAEKMINDVINQFAEYTATDLTSLSQNQAPWNNIYEPYTNNEITKESIKEYFSD